MLRVSVPAFVALACLAGCAAQIPFEGDRSRERIAHDLGIGADAIVREDRCVVSRYDGRAAAPGFECIYVATPQYAALLDFDTGSRQFKETLRINRESDSIAFVTHTKLFTLSQIQLHHAGQTYALEFVTADLGQLGHEKDLRDAYEQLRAIGVKETDGVPYIQRMVAPTPITIPITVRTR